MCKVEEGEGNKNCQHMLILKPQQGERVLELSDTDKEKNWSSKMRRQRKIISTL